MRYSRGLALGLLLKEFVRQVHKVEEMNVYRLILDLKRGFPTA
jgi:hypothetical protein